MKETKIQKLDRAEIERVLNDPETDPRFLELYESLRVARGNDTAQLDILSSSSGNLFLRGVLFQEGYVEAARQYFSEEKHNGEYPPFMFPEFQQVTPRWCTSRYLRRFDDGLVQFAGFGELWESRPGHSWALYGHVVSV